MSLRRRWLPILLAGCFVVAMVAVATVSGCTEILFPEMTAILCGAWIQPRQAWNVSRRWMLVLMTSGAVFGIAVNLLVPAPLAVRACLGYVFCALVMHAAGADMTPMLSAAILPMLIGTTSWAYPVAVFVLVCLVLAGQVALERVGLREPIESTPLRGSGMQFVTMWGRRFLVFALLSCPAYMTGNAYLAVPPLLVAYTELTRPDMTLRLKPWNSWAVLAGASLVGSLARCAVEYAGVPAWVAVIPAYLALVLLWNAARTWLPPAGAIVLLALLVPWRGPWLYPIEVSLGAAAWVAAALLLFPGIRPSSNDEERIRPRLRLAKAPWRGNRD